MVLFIASLFCEAATDPSLKISIVNKISVSWFSTNGLFYKILSSKKVNGPFTNVVEDNISGWGGIIERVFEPTNSPTFYQVERITTKPNLSDKYEFGVIYDGINFSEVDFSRSMFQFCLFRNCNFTGASITNGVIFTECDFSEAIGFYPAEWPQSIFRNCLWWDGQYVNDNWP